MSREWREHRTVEDVTEEDEDELEYDEEDEYSDDEDEDEDEYETEEWSPRSSPYPEFDPQGAFLATNKSSQSEEKGSVGWLYLISAILIFILIVRYLYLCYEWVVMTFSTQPKSPSHEKPSNL